MIDSKLFENINAEDFRVVSHLEHYIDDEIKFIFEDDNGATFTVEAACSLSIDEDDGSLNMVVWKRDCKKVCVNGFFTRTPIGPQIGS